MARSLTWDDSTLNECDDGTICENGSKCVRHPYKEGKYICDCLAASNDIFYAGIYCEHKATDTCSEGGDNGPSFCTNYGSCTTKPAGENDEHVACNCKPGYVGDYCQFVAGSKPSDWQLSHFMHPVLMNSVVQNQGLGDGAIAGISIGGALVAMVGVTLVFMWCGKMSNVLGRNEKEMDTGDARRSGSKKNSAGAFVATSDNLDADGGVLKEALEDNFEMEEVDLSDLELVEETAPTGELA